MAATVTHANAHGTNCALHARKASIEGRASSERPDGPRHRMYPSLSHCEILTRAVAATERVEYPPPLPVPGWCSYKGATMARFYRQRYQRMTCARAKHLNPNPTVLISCKMQPLTLID